MDSIVKGMETEFPTVDSFSSPVTEKISPEVNPEVDPETFRSNKGDDSSKHSHETDEKYGYSSENVEEACSEHKSEEKEDKYGYRSFSDSSESEESHQGGNTAEDFKEILDLIEDEGYLEHNTAEHKGLIDHVVSLVGKTQELGQIRALIKERLAKFQEKGYEPKALTVGGFFFGCYLSEDKYQNGNKYCDSLCAFSLPDFLDEKQKCNENVFYFHDSKTVVCTDNGEKTALVHLGEEYRNLEEEHKKDIRKYGCQKARVYKNGKFQYEVDVSRSQHIHEISDSSEESHEHKHKHHHHHHEDKSSCSSSRKSSSCSRSSSSSSCEEKKKECESSCLSTCETGVLSERISPAVAIIVIVIILLIIYAAVGRRALAYRQ